MSLEMSNPIWIMHDPPKNCNYNYSKYICVFFFGRIYIFPTFFSKSLNEIDNNKEYWCFENVLWNHLIYLKSSLVNHIEHSHPRCHYSTKIRCGATWYKRSKCQQISAKCSVDKYFSYGLSLILRIRKMCMLFSVNLLTRFYGY